MEEQNLWNILFIIFLVFCAAVVVAVVIWLATSVIYDIKSKRLQWDNPEEYARREMIKKSYEEQTTTRRE